MDNLKRLAASALLLYSALTLTACAANSPPLSVAPPVNPSLPVLSEAKPPGWYSSKQSELQAKWQRLVNSAKPTSAP